MFYALNSNSYAYAPVLLVNSYGQRIYPYTLSSPPKMKGSLSNEYGMAMWVLWMCMRDKRGFSKRMKNE